MLHFWWSERARGWLEMTATKDMLVDLAEKLASIIGFEYVILPVRDGKYGSQDSSGAWNGMVGELVRKVGWL